MTHSSKQEELCKVKAQVLIDYVRTPAKVVPNLGYGDLSCVFSTLLTPALSEFERICYVPNTKDPGRLTKRVTAEWVSQLTWEAVAWWYMDDGSRAGSNLQFHTQSFSVEEVDLLVGWFQQNGVPATRVNTKGRHGKIYQTLLVLGAGTRKVLEKTRPFAVESMLYKWEIQTKEWLCEHCGTHFLTGLGLPGAPRIIDPDYPCCGKEICRRKQHDRQNSEYVQRIGGTKELYRRHLEKLKADPMKRAEERRKSAENARNRRKDPSYRDKWNAYKKVYRKQRKAEGNPDSPPRLEHSCQYCGKKFRNTHHHKIVRGAKRIFCTATECVARRDTEIAEERSMKAKQKRRMVLTCQYCMEEFQNTKDHRLSPNAPIIFCQKPACVLKRDEDYAEMRKVRRKELRQLLKL